MLLNFKEYGSKFNTMDFKDLVENEPRVHFKIKPGQNVLLRRGITENNVELWMY